MVERLCLTCSYFKTDYTEEEIRRWRDGKPDGECRRHAPRPGSPDRLNHQPHWPQVSAFDWCGEFRERSK